MRPCARRIAPAGTRTKASSLDACTVGRAPRRRAAPAALRSTSSLYTRRVLLLKPIFWGALGALAWTHVAYPAAAEVAARLRTRRVRKDESAEPSVTVIIPAYNEEAVIERRLENLLALDYPSEKLQVVVASDASSDRTNELVEGIAAREPRVSLLDCPRGGKVAAQDRAVRRRRARSSPSRTATRPGRPMRSGTSLPTSPTRTSRTSAASFGSRTPQTATRRAPTGATR